MHPALLGAYARMLPRLEAERDLRMMNAVAAGSGSMKPDSFRRYVRQLTKAARPPQRPRSLEQLQALGIEVVREVKDG